MQTLNREQRAEMMREYFTGAKKAAHELAGLLEQIKGKSWTARYDKKLPDCVCAHYKAGQYSAYLIFEYCDTSKEKCRFKDAMSASYDRITLSYTYHSSNIGRTITGDDVDGVNRSIERLDGYLATLGEYAQTGFESLDERVNSLQSAIEEYNDAYDELDYIDMMFCETRDLHRLYSKINPIR